MTMIFQDHLRESFHRHKDRTAIAAPGRNVTYYHLKCKADGITTFLLQQGIAAGTVIGIRLDNRIDLIAAMIGVINARCVFMFIDGAWPAGRLAQVISKAALRYVISAAKQPLVLQEQAVEQYFLEDMPVLEADMAAHLYPVFEEDDSLYIYFTSGSTGVPKGIVGRNASLLQFIRWETGTFSCDEHIRVSQFISPFFDAFLRDVFVPLCAGGTLCIPPAGKDFFAAETMAKWINDTGVHLIHCVPSVFRIIKSADLQAADFASLRYIMMSGEKIFPQELVDWYELFGDRIRLVNLYGPTETTMIRTCYEIQPADVRLDKIPIGQPIWDTDILITRDGRTPCGVLKSGELYIISRYVTKGYLHEPEMTAERFIPWNDAGQVAFKTGDQARILSNGNIVLLGRNDRQVKVNGVRIELDEIEHVLADSGLASHVAVVVQESGSMSIHAFVILNEKGKALPDPVKAMLLHLRNLLPDYAVPASLQVLDTYPLLETGKVDYRQLLKLIDEQPVVAPADEWEAAVLALWQDVLGKESISVTASFLIVGGNSLAIMSLIGRIYKQFHVRVSLSELFKHLTIRQQAALVRAGKRDDVMTISQAPVMPAYPLSRAQSRIYYHYMLDSSSTAYNLPVAFEIKGVPDLPRINRAMQQLLERQESLRTRFFTADGQLFQEVMPATILPEEISYDGEDLQEAVRQFVRPFVLDEAPLFRYAIITGRNGIRLLVTDVHHIVCDGQSQLNIYKDFIAFYNDASPDPLPVQYKDYAVWEEGFRRSSAYLSHREFWLGHLQGATLGIDFHVGGPIANSAGHAGHNTHFFIDAKYGGPLLARLRQAGITDFSAWFSIFMIFLHRISGQHDLVACATSSGRMLYGLSDLAGMFVKILPIRFKMRQDQPFVNIAADLHRFFIAAGSKQLYDLSDIVQELNERKTPATDRIADVMFVYQNFESERSLADDTVFRSFDVLQHTSKNPLTLYASEEADGFHFRFEYAESHFKSSDIAVFVLLFQELTIWIAEHPELPLADYVPAGGSRPVTTREDIVFNF